MKFSTFLLSAIQRSEIPLRFEPGAEEAVAQPVTEFLKAWVMAHEPGSMDSEYDRARMAVVRELLEELNDARPLPE
jgi:hypothetical protein